MLSPTSQRSSSYRTLTTSAVLAVTIIILLSFYNLRDARVAASSGSPEATSVARYNATRYTSSVSHASGNEQEGAKEPKEQALKFTDSLSHKPENQQDAARLPMNHAAKLTSSVSHTPGNEHDTAKVPENHAASSVSHTPGNEQDTVKVPANVVSSSALAATLAIDVAIPSTPAAPNEPRRAFVTFLEADTGTNHNDQEEGTNADNEDAYFVGALYRPSNLISSKSLTRTSHSRSRLSTHASA